MEIWKNINYKNYGEQYQVSNHGNVKNSKTGRILKPTLRMGYNAISLSARDNKKTLYNHRLAALVFVPNNDLSKNFVNHIDGNKLNNHVDNLEWTTPKENTQHALRTKLTMPPTRKVKQYDSNGNFIREYISMRDAEKTNNLPRDKLSQYCKNSKVYGGYIWKYSLSKEHEKTDDKHIVIQGYPNYEITENGLVYSVKYKRYMVQKTTGGGYKSVKLCNDGANKDHYVHRLVAEHYLEKPNKNDQIIVNHKDRNKTNNRVENLEWVSHRENAQHYQDNKHI